MSEEAFEIVLLAPELLGRTFGIVESLIDSGARRRLDAVHLLYPEGLVGLLAHPKILLARSIPRSSAATSSSSL